MRGRYTLALGSGPTITDFTGNDLNFLVQRIALVGTML